MEEDCEPRIETILKITPKPNKVNLIDQREVTDNAEMTIIDDHKKTMFETHQKSALNMTDIPRTNALAHYKNEFADTNLAEYDEEFAAALNANGIKFAVTTLATDTLDEELVAAATFATNIEKFDAITALTDYDEEFATIFALLTYDEKFGDNTPAHYDVEFDAIFADYDGESIATDTLNEELVAATTLALTTNEEFNDTTPAHYDVKFDTTFAGYDGESIATDALDEESTNVALAYNDEQFDEIPTPIFAYYDGECAAAHADYDEEVATIHASTEKEAAATFATHDEKIAAVTGESGGLAK
jgi:hypothetical protein